MIDDKEYQLPAGRVGRVSRRRKPRENPRVKEHRLVPGHDQFSIRWKSQLPPRDVLPLLMTSA
jgi:hypothetical protein